MATDAVLFYEKTAGEYRGVFIAHCGQNVKRELEKRFGHDREALIAWVENAEGHYGYVDATDDTLLVEEEDREMYPLLTNDELDRLTFDFDWLITSTGSIEAVTITSKKVVQITVTAIAE